MVFPTGCLTDYGARSLPAESMTAAGSISSRARSVTLYRWSQARVPCSLRSQRVSRSITDSLLTGHHQPT
jgi:hypothetical protein